MPRLRIDDENRKWWVVAGTGSALAIVLLEEVLVGVALPTIRDELGMSQLLAQWIVTAYVLALTAFVAAAGRLGDILGHGRVFIAGAAILGLGSLGAGISPTAEWLIASRAVQGLGTAGILSLSVAMTGIAFPTGQRGLAIGVYGVIGAVAAAFGPVLGGVLTDVASWRWIFFLNLPLLGGLITITALAWREPDHASRRTSFDTRGLVLLLAVLVPLVLALMQAPVWGWGSAAVIALFSIAAAAVPTFVWLENRAENPLIEVGLLRRPTIVGSNLVLSCAQFSKIAVIVFGALFLQDELGFSPLLSGVAMLPAMIPVVFVSVLGGQLTDRYGSRLPTLFGVGLMTLALASLALLVPEERYVTLVPGLIVWGFALTFLITPPQTAILNAVAAGKRGEAAGVASTGRMLGSTLAIATLGAVFVASGSFALLFIIAAAVTVAVWIAAFALIERPARSARLGRESVLSG